MSTRAINLSAVLAPLAQDLRTLIDNSFQQSRSPGGDDWRPLSPRTIARRRHGSGSGPRAKPLIDTGRLRNSLQVVAQPRSIQFGTSVEYAGPQQFGTKTIPARPFLPVTGSGEFMNAGPAEAWLDEAAEMIADYIETGRVRK